jgi:carotenoid cleavage dioxygenase-like enzyme
MAEAAPQDRLRIVDPAANSYLSGRYAPVDQETDADDLQVEGTLPADIDGVFIRNGPNPQFPPLVLQFRFVTWRPPNESAGYGAWAAALSRVW